MVARVSHALMLPAFVVLAGCGHLPFFSDGTVATADDAASVHVSALSVSNWDDVQADLQPSFSIDPAGALALAVPTTELFEDRFFDALKLAMQVAAPTVSKTSKTTTTGAPGNTATNIETTKTSSPGDLGAVDDPALATAAAASIPSRIGDWKVADMDPMLKYLAATAVYQEIKLLSRYVKDTVRWQGSQAYAVRLQLAVLPHQRNLSYDSVTDITFFPQDLEATVGLAQLAESKPLHGPCPAGQTDRVAVVPMLVTDNLEGMMRSRSADSIRQFGLSLLAMIDGIGGSANYGGTSERLQQILGRDVNSVLTVARVSNDTVRIRLGAVQNTESQYSMLPRTNNITVLVMYRPCDPNTIPTSPTQHTLTAVSHTSFVNATNGTILPTRDHLQQTSIDAAALNQRYHINLSVAQYVQLYIAASRDDWTTFNTVLSALAPELVEIVRPGLWVDLIGLRSRGEYSFTPIPIMVRKPTPTLPADQLALVADDKTGASVILQQAQDLRALDHLSATITIGKVRVPSRTLEASGNSAIRATFPPLAALVAEKPKEPLLLEVTATGIPAKTYAVRLVPAEKEAETKPAFALSLPSSVVVAGEAGAGRANLIVRAVPDGSKDPLFLTITGGDVRAVEKVRGAPLTETADGWKIGSAGEVTLLLGNLAAGQQLTASLRNAKGAAVGQPETRQIVAGPSKASQ